MEIYIIDGKEYNISSWEQSEKDEWIKEHPKAKLKTQTEDFSNGVAGTGTTAASGTVVPDGESNLEAGSLEFPISPKQFGNELEGVSLDEIRKNTKESKKLNPVVKPKITQLQFDNIEEEELVGGTNTRAGLQALYPDMLIEEAIGGTDAIKVKIPGDTDWTKIILNTDYNEQQDVSQSGLGISGDSKNPNAYSEFMALVERSKATTGIQRDIFDESRGAITIPENNPVFGVYENQYLNSTNDDFIPAGTLASQEQTLDIVTDMSGILTNILQGDDKLIYGDQSIDESGNAILPKLRTDYKPEEQEGIREQVYNTLNQNLTDQGKPKLTLGSFETIYAGMYEDVLFDSAKQAQSELDNSTLEFDMPSSEFSTAFKETVFNSYSSNEQKKVKFEDDLKRLDKSNREIDLKLSADDLTPNNQKLLNLQKNRNLREIGIVNNGIKGLGQKEVTRRVGTGKDQMLGIDSSITTIENDPDDATNTRLIVEKQTETSGLTLLEAGSRTDIKTSPQEHANRLLDEKVFNLQKIQQLGIDEKFKLKESDMLSERRKGKDEDFRKYTEMSPLLRKLRSSGYKTDEEGNFDVSAWELRQLGFDSRNFEGWLDRSDTKKYMSEANIGKILAFEEQYDTALAEARGMYRLAKLNVDVGKLEKNWFGENFVAESGSNILQSWGGYTKKEAEKALTGNEDGFVRSMLDSFDRAKNEYNASDEVVGGNVDKIELTAEQEENISKTWSEDISQGVGEFAPMIIEMGVLSASVGGAFRAIGFADKLAKWSKGKNTFDKLKYHLSLGITEEAKMQLAFDMKPGGGATFYGLGAATKGFTPFTNKFKWMDGAYQKVIKGGPIGAISMDTAALTEAAVEDLFSNNTEFSDVFQDLFGDSDVAQKRFITNTAIFGITGVHSLKGTDLMSTQYKLQRVNDMRQKRYDLVGYKKKVGIDGKKLIEVDGKTMTEPNAPFNYTESYEKLSKKDKARHDSLLSAENAMFQLFTTEAHGEKLNPKNKNFEANFNELVVSPIAQVMKQTLKSKNGEAYKGFDVVFVNNENKKQKAGMVGTEKALYQAGTGKNRDKIFINKDQYTAGSAIHEFTHLAMETFFNANPNVEMTFSKSLGDVFKDFSFPVDATGLPKTGKEIEGAVGQNYSKGQSRGLDLRTKEGKALKAKEVFSYIAEFASNPEFYYSNPKLANTFLKQVKTEVVDWAKANGFAKQATPPKTAGDVVRLLAKLGQDVRFGNSQGIETAFKTLTRLDKIDILGFERQYLKDKALTNKLAKQKDAKIPAASKQIFQQTDIVYQENKQFWKDKSINKEERNKLVTEMSYEWTNEIERRLQGLEGMSRQEIQDIALEFTTAEKRGLRNLIEKFDQNKLVNEKGEPYESISAYLNTPGVINKRLIEFYQDSPNYNKISKSLSSEGMKELVAPESSTFESSRVSKLIDLSKKLGVEKEVNSIIEKNFNLSISAPFSKEYTFKQNVKDLNYKKVVNELESIIDKKLTKQFISMPQNAKMLYNALPEGVMSSGKSTGVKQALLDAFYVKSDTRSNALLGKSKAGLSKQVKQPFDLAKWKNYINRRTNKDGKLERINDQLNPRLERLRQEIGKAMTNQSIRRLGSELLRNEPQLKNILEKIADGKSPGLASKFMDFAGNEGIKSASDLQAKRFEKGVGLFLKDKEKFYKEYPEFENIINNFTLKYYQGKVKALKKSNPTFKSMVKNMPEFIETPFGKISKNEILTEGVGVGMFGQVGETKTVINKKGEKVKVREKLFEWFDVPEIKTFLEGTVGKDGVRRGGIYGKDGLATVFPKWITEILGTGGTLEASFALSFRASGMGEKPKADSRSKTYKYEKGTTLEAAYSLPKNQKENLLKAFGTGKNVTKILDKLRDAVFMGEGVQKKRVLDSWDKLTEKQKIEKLKEAINPNDNKQKTNLYFALESIKQEWLYSAPTKQRFVERAQVLLNIASKNSNLIKGYNRQFVPIVAVLYKGQSSKQMKLEHVKSSLEQSMQATMAIIEGRWIKDGKKIMNDFSGIISTKEFLNEIDKFGGTTNTAGIARMTANLENLKNYRTVESGFKETLYDKVVREAAQEIGAKTRELGLNFLKDQLAKYVENPSATNKVILKQALNNKKTAKEVFDNNVKIAKKAGVKGNNNAEIIVDLAKKDKQTAKEIKDTFASKDLSKEFNNIIEQSSGVEGRKTYSDIRAKSVGAKKRKWQLFIPDSAADLNGLIDVTLGKGKKGDAHRKWYKNNIIEPFNKAEAALTADRITLNSGFKALKKQLKVVPKDLRKQAIEGFTFEQAIRVHTWNKQGMKVEGLSKRDLKELSEIIEKNPELNAFSEQLIELSKGEGYPAPPKEWLAGSIATDLRTGLNRGGRAKYLEATGYTENVSKIYSKENLNKLEAVYGSKYRVALENMLGRMKTGVNRKPSANALENRALDWINNANGVTMFLNSRSAVLQTLSSLNYINWTDNNPLKAGKALANQPQYWKDFMEIMNSDYLVDRRNGLKLNVSESEIADAAKSSTNSAKGAINYLLSKGFMFTRIADSFAIASGGASFFRNRINTYKKQGLSEKQAKEKAFIDFKEISEISQQSANVSKISMEQSSTLGRLVLAFANTPMQYARLQKSAIKDLANGRGDYKSNLSKVMYYGFVQNLMFNALQNALFTNIWEDNPDPKKEDLKNARIANGMADSILRGMGIGGAAVSTIKNVLLKIKSESEKSRPKYEAAALEVFDFLPPIDSKVRKLLSAGKSMTWDADDMKYMSMMDPKNPAYLAGANVISAATNFPADRIVKKITNMQGVMTDEMEMWQRIARFAGWSEWEIGPQQFKPSKPKKRKGGLTISPPTISLPTISLPKF